VQEEEIEADGRFVFATWLSSCSPSRDSGLAELEAARLKEEFEQDMRFLEKVRHSNATVPASHSSAQAWDKELSRLMGEQQALHQMAGAAGCMRFVGHELQLR
jgi:hypothetical protein